MEHFPQQNTRRLNRCLSKEARSALISVIDGDKNTDSTFLPEPLLGSFNMFLNLENGPLKNSYCDVFAQLSNDSSMDTVLPFVICKDCLDISGKALIGMLEGEEYVKFCDMLDYFNPEISHLLRQSMSSFGAPTDDIFKLIHFCASFVSDYHSKDVIPVNSSMIPGSYNPPRDGRAYYFSKEGCQLRRMRSFPIDKEKKKLNDDASVTACSKIYPQVTKRGRNFLFLWFCPLHGHCFGFHIIPESEGRKDPAASLYLFKEQAPEVVIYDFACSLDEYVRNRESGYFSQTRFFHDIFHGFSHKCGSNFRCGRLKGLKVNTSICEQFNSYMQCIKTSAKLMTQTHFTFYAQFFIHLWNIEKFENFNRRLSIVRSGEQ